MRIDAPRPALSVTRPRERPSWRPAGHDGIWTGESSHDPFLRLLQVAEATDRLTLGTSIAIAFGHAPPTVAHVGHDHAS